MPRLFVAIEVPDEVKAALGAALGELRQDRAVRWSPPETLHLTLKFLGETEESAVPAITSALERATAGHAPFDVALGGFGTFPPRGAPRVLWVRVRGDVERLVALASAIDSALAPLGVEPDDRAFAPHLTIGRARGDARRIAASLADLGPIGTFRADRVVLFRSELSPRGAIHTVRATLPLASALPGAQIPPA